MTAYPYQRTRVKICGITRPEDGRVVADAGADAIGLVFYAPSPRFVTIEQAREVIEALPPLITKVALFVDADRTAVERVLAELSIDLLQFHGKEAPDYCASFGRSYIKAVRMAPDVNIEAVAESYATAGGLLLDSYQKGVPGGTGHAFDWARVPKTMAMPIILAGGLEPGNVQDAITTARPYAVDVSSGVEASKGIKDAGKISEFMQQVHSADIKVNQ